MSTTTTKPPIPAEELVELRWLALQVFYEGCEGIEAGTTDEHDWLRHAVLEDAAQIAMGGIARALSDLDTEGFNPDDLVLLSESGRAFVVVGDFTEDSPVRDSIWPGHDRSRLDRHDVALLRRLAERHRDTYAGWAELEMLGSGDACRAQVARAERVLAALGEGRPA